MHVAKLQQTSDGTVQELPFNPDRVVQDHWILQGKAIGHPIMIHPGKINT